jgi:transcriptional regulator with XRE-family HTH domain
MAAADRPAVGYSHQYGLGRSGRASLKARFTQNGSTTRSVNGPTTDDPMAARIKAEFGRLLKESRAARGLTQERLATVSKLDRSYVAQLDRGLRQPTLTTLWRLARGLNKKPTEMIAFLDELWAREGPRWSLTRPRATDAARASAGNTPPAPRRMQRRG